MKLYPSQIAIAEKWLAERPGRFRTKRLRKKFWSRPDFYFTWTNYLILSWSIPIELLREEVEKAIPIRALLKEEDFKGKYFPVPAVDWTRSDVN